MVSTRSKTSSSMKNSRFVLNWKGTRHGQGEYTFESMWKRKAVWSHVHNKKYVIWSQRGEWFFAKRPELSKKDPGMFAWCSDAAKIPTDIRANWQIPHASSMEWIDCLDFKITPLLNRGASDSSDDGFSESGKDFSSCNVSSEVASQAKRALKTLNDNVSKNYTEVHELKGKVGSIDNPRNVNDLKPLEKRLYKLEKDELEKTTAIVKRVEDVYSQVQGFCRKSKSQLKKEELRVLKQWDMLKYTTFKQLKDFLREKRNEKYFIRGYGFIKLAGSKKTLAKRVKRVLDQIEQDEDTEQRKQKDTLQIKKSKNKLEKGPSRHKRRKVCSSSIVG